MTEYKLRPRRRAADSVDSGERPQGERVYSTERRTSYGERPQRSYGERKPYGERRTYGEHPQGERRSYGNDERRSYGDRPQRTYGDRTQGERRSYGNDERRSYGDRPQRTYGERTQGERRSYGNDERRSYGDRPQRSYGDRPKRSYNEGENPEGGERRNGFGRSRGNFGDRKGGEFRGAKGFGKKGGFKGRKAMESAFNENDEETINTMISRSPQLDPSKYSDNDFAPTPLKEEMRLNKFIANSGVCSRREADTFIEAGVVTVNGEVVTELGTKINALKDDIRFNGERLKGEEKVYIVMNKPKGYVTTASDPHAEKTVMDLLRNCSARVFAVGRLDKNTTGVLMFTNDGEIAERLTHPSYDKKKIYQVLIDKPLAQEHFDNILAGITLNDGEVKADALEYTDDNDKRKLGIEIHSGKNRIVRRIFESFGYDVKALDRVYFAGLTKKGLKKGEWRYLSEGEVNILKMGAYI